MNVTYSEKVKQSPDYAQLKRDTDYLKGVVDRGMKDLEAFVSPSLASVSAEWDCVLDEQGRPLYTLKLSGFSQEVSATFSPSDLRQDMRFLLVRLWSDLLQAYLDARMKRHLVLEGSSGGETDAR